VCNRVTRHERLRAVRTARVSLRERIEIFTHGLQNRWECVEHDHGPGRGLDLETKACP
jgi:hypothetical protein